MNIKAPKIIKGTLAFIATLLVLYGARFLWQNYSVVMPLNEGLMSIQGVQGIVLEKPSKIYEPIIINISLNNISNFQKTYAEINEEAVQALKGKAYKINIKYNGSDELEKLYSDISIYVEKALIDGSFPSLVEKSDEIANAIGAESKIFIDSKYIYLHMTKGDKSLYKLIPRQAQKAGDSK
ncbi:hypothetical protein [Lutispora saccharofermentans]|uniref:Uncharacterized protein n=1 Tax=Lutispora saccharofermentans TaxID=3024236 RepID=A0ABT1NAH7_9FIRM|nr:hypothetical protein [Lutispora saccharofermentans]MCQ1528248.1 hypothetical protein [Lutispora saccharofermentans]